MIKHYIFEEKGIYYVNVARIIETTVSFNKDKISEKEILALNPEGLFTSSNYVMSGDEEDCIESFEFRVKVFETYLEYIKRKLEHIMWKLKWKVGIYK